MAKRRRRSSKTGDAPVAQRMPAAPEAPASPPEPSASPPEPGPTSTRAFAAVLALAVLAQIILGAPPGHEFGTLYDIGRTLAVLGLALALVRHAIDHALTRALAPWALVLMIFGLGALLGRHAWGFRVFADTHPADFGVPSELAWVVLVIGLRRVAWRPGKLAFGALALGVGWGLVALVVPEPGLAQTTTALGAALSDPMRTLLALLLLATLLLGLATLGAHLLARPPARFFATSTRYLPPALALALIMSGLASEAPLQAIAAALLLVAIGLHAEIMLADRDSHERARNDRALLYATLAVICGLWLLIKSHALIASNTDENIYFYMAKILADGQWPYADYFFAHPPLHVVLPGLAFSIFGFSLTLAKLFPMLTTLVGGLAVWGIARRSISPLAAPLALVLYLFGTEVLKASSNMTGVNMTAMWLLLGTWQALRGHPIRAGAMLGAAVTTGFYAMAPALAAIAIGFFWHDPDSGRRRAGLRHGLGMLAGFVIVAGGLNIIFYALGGDTFLEGVYAYHQQKSFENIEMVETFGGSPGFPASIVHNLGLMVAGADFTKELFYHAHLWLAGLALPLVVLAGWIRGVPDWRARGEATAPLYRALYPTMLFRAGSDGRALVIWLIALALFVQYAMFRELYSFYFVLIYPFLALAAAYVIWRGIALLVPAQTPSRAPPDRPPRRPLLAAVLALIAVLGLGWHGVLASHAGEVFDDELEVVGSRNDYAWTEPPALASLGGITKLLFWEGHRLKSGVEPGYRHYLWTKKRGFTVLDEVAAHIRATSTPEESIAGSSTLAPLVALLADRRIAANEIDTNNKRFQTKLLLESDYWEAICKDHVRYLVAAPRSYFTSESLDALPVVRRAFVKDRAFADPTLQYSSPFPIVLYRRVDGAACGWP